LWCATITNYATGLIREYAIGRDQLPSLIEFFFKVMLAIFNGCAAVFTVIRKNTLTPFTSGLIAIITSKPVRRMTSPIKTVLHPGFNGSKEFSILPRLAAVFA
jgi:hypothetical protein